MSLVPLIDGSLAKRGKPIGFESKGQLAWVGDRYKIYSQRQRNGQPKFKLFDLVADPSEKNDLAKTMPRLSQALGRRAGGVARLLPNERRRKGLLTVRRRRLKRRWLRWLLLLAVLDAAVFYWWWNNQAERRYNSIIRDAAEEFGVEYALIKAVIWQESRFREDALGEAGEIGLMQLMELAAFEWADNHGVRDFEHSHVYDPRTNILAGTYYIKTRLDRYPHTDDPLPFALADYNAGRARREPLGQGGSPHQQHCLPPKHRLPLDAPLHRPSDPVAAVIISNNRPTCRLGQAWVNCVRAG